MLSHLSQIVVAPIVMGYNQLGHPFSCNILYATCRCPACVSACSITGVPAKPVLILQSPCLTSRMSLSAAPSYCDPSSRSHRYAMQYAVCVSDERRPEGVTYSS